MTLDLTKAQSRALQAVRDGLVTRHYVASGNSFRGPAGVGAASYWRLEKAGLIEDGKGAGKWPISFPVQLTAAGRAALSGEER